MEIKRPESNLPISKNAKRVFKGEIFDVYQWEQELYDGSKATFEKLKRSDTVVVFPVLDDGRIILTEQEQPNKKNFIGATGGRVDEGEAVIAAAKRELWEESGYEAERFVLWTAEQVTSKIDWAIFVFVAKGLQKVSEQKLDAGEKINLKIVTFDEFLDIVTDPRFAEKEIVAKVLEAKLDPEKMKALKDLFRPIL